MSPSEKISCCGELHTLMAAVEGNNVRFIVNKERGVSLSLFFFQAVFRVHCCYVSGMMSSVALAAASTPVP